jgi:hypothetical protein
MISPSKINILKYTYAHFIFREKGSKKMIGQYYHKICRVSNQEGIISNTVNPEHTLMCQKKHKRIQIAENCDASTLPCLRCKKMQHLPITSTTFSSTSVDCSKLLEASSSPEIEQTYGVQSIGWTDHKPLCDLEHYIYIV